MTSKNKTLGVSFIIPTALLSLAAIVLTVFGVIGLFDSSDVETEPILEVADVVPSPAWVDVTIEIIEEKPDPEAPTLCGVRERYGYVGDKINYSSGVFAIGKMGRSTQIHIDASQVDVNTPGTYPVTYAAIDSEGHCTEIVSNVAIYKSSTVRLDVENMMQMPTLPNGCEVVSLSIVLKYKGYQVLPTKLFDDYMPHSYGFKNTNFWDYYVGDPRTEGCGCYAPCVVKTANDYLDSRESSLNAYDVSGSSFAKLESYLDRDIPVIIWGTMDMCGLFSEVAYGYVDGERVSWNLFSHCLVMIGYNEDVYIFCDPMRGIVEYSKEAVEKSYNIAYKQACVIY